jgi:hypothetical protein
MSTSSVFQGSFNPEQTTARVFIANPSDSMCQASPNRQYRSVSAARQPRRAPIEQDHKPGDARQRH